MEELDECEVLWPETWHTIEPPPVPAPPVPVHPSPSEATAALSRPVDVPSAKATSVRSCHWNGPTRDGDCDGGDDIVPPHLLLSGRRRSEAETAWSLRASGPPCRRARDLRHLRDAVLRMTGFIEG